jgi:hypothetical protein
MQQTNRGLVWATTIVVGALVLAVGFFLFGRTEDAKSWDAAVEGFLAVATPCCTEASLWNSLDEVTADRQRARPASTAEAARWLNDWPYKGRNQEDASDERGLDLAAQSSEVRCVGAPTGPEVPREGDDEQTLKALRHRRECTYAKWKVWTAETADEHLGERHTVWVDEDGFFRGRVDYWR